MHTTFCNGSSYDYHFIIKELAKEFKTKFTCLGENTEKYILYSSNRKRGYKNWYKWRRNYEKYILHITIYWEC